nr:unnamed protein product [Callosobruchus chinensis]
MKIKHINKSHVFIDLQETILVFPLEFPTLQDQTRLRERSSYQGFQSLTLGERKKRKLYSPTVWERSKRFSESLVKDPNPHKLFL